MEALDKYSIGVPPILWLPWTPQLLNCLVLYEGNVILNLLCQVGRMYPQAVYFPIRTLYLTLRTATARKTNTVQVSAVVFVLLSTFRNRYLFLSTATAANRKSERKRANKRTEQPRSCFDIQHFRSDNSRSSRHQSFTGDGKMFPNHENAA